MHFDINNVKIMCQGNFKPFMESLQLHMSVVYTLCALIETCNSVPLIIYEYTSYSIISGFPTVRSIKVKFKAKSHWSKPLNVDFNLFVTTSDGPVVYLNSRTLPMRLGIWMGLAL